MTTSQGSRLRPSQRMRIAYLLTIVGGYLDAYTYFMRGGVFANAQTGNIVKLGIALADDVKNPYASYLLPIASFVLGLVLSLVIKRHLDRAGVRLARRTVLALEVIGLVVVSLIPLDDVWNTPANCIVSMLAALQYETFTTFRGDAIVTTMSTGNLRKMVDALFEGTVEHDRASLMRAGRFLSIIAAFAFGAFLGTKACSYLVGWAPLPAAALLTVAIVIITVLHRQSD